MPKRSCVDVCIVKRKSQTIPNPFSRILWAAPLNAIFPRFWNRYNSSKVAGVRKSCVGAQGCLSRVARTSPEQVVTFHKKHLRIRDEERQFSNSAVPRSPITITLVPCWRGNASSSVPKAKRPPKSERTYGDPHFRSKFCIKAPQHQTSPEFSSGGIRRGP